MKTPLLIASVLFLTSLPPFFMTGCGGTSSSAPGTATSVPAQVGAAFVKLETPPVVQIQTTFLTAEVLNRAVKPEERPKVAAWCACISRALRQFSGDGLPDQAQLKAAIELQTGPITDPEFPAIEATVLDLWASLRTFIPAGSTAATVVLYTNAVATGVDNASAGYLAPK